MAQSAQDRDAILAIARAQHLAVISASDNHGWGRTAPAWSVMRIPGWRGMTPAELDIAIRSTIVAEGPRAIEVIARRTAAPPGNGLEAAAGGIAVTVTMMRTMSLPDRFSWIVWSWSLCFLSLRSHRRKRETFGVRAAWRRARKLTSIREAAA